MKLKSVTGLLAVASTALAVNSFSAFAADSVPVNKGMDIASLCGTKPTKVALIDGYGGNTWRKIAEAELRDEAAKCKNVTEVQYTDAGGDAQAYAAAINSYTAQGFNIIVAFADFGDGSLPAFKAATAAGVTVVPYLAKLSGKAGVDYTINPYQDTSYGSHKFAEWTCKALKGKGTALMLGGLPNSASSQEFMNGFTDGLKACPDVKLLDKNYIVTNWNPADAQKAVAGLIAKYPQIDAIASDYGVTSLGAAKAFDAAGLKIPALSAIATNNEINCKYKKAKGTDKAFNWFALDGSTADVRFAFRQGMASYQGVAISEPPVVQPVAFADSLAGLDPKCSDTAPPDADMSSSLSDDKLNALFKK